jgi:hypothetical protein
MLARITIAIAVALAGAACLAGGAVAKTLVVTKTVTFTTSDTCKAWTAPKSILSMRIEAIGAAGVAGGTIGSIGAQAPGYSDGYWYGKAGLGDEVKATLSGPLGAEKFDVCVDTDSDRGAADYNSGGFAGYHDPGGASGVSVGADFSHPAVIAGGGGDGGAACDGEAETPYAAECAGFPPGTHCCNGGNAGIQGGNGGDVPTISSSAFNGGIGGDWLLAGPGGYESGGISLGFTQSYDGPSGGYTNTAGPGAGSQDGDEQPYQTASAGGGAGYTGGGGGAAFVASGPTAGSPGYVDSTGGGGGSDFCVPKTQAESAVKLPPAFHTTDCKIVSGAGTRPDAGTARGDAKVVITYTTLSLAPGFGLPTLPISPPTVQISAPTGSATFLTAGTTTSAGALSMVTGGEAPVAKFSCTQPGLKHYIKSCVATVLLPAFLADGLGGVKVLHASQTVPIHSGATLPGSIGGDYPSCETDTLSVTATNKDGKIASASRSYCVYVASSVPPRTTPPPK